jgi:hypothetical protein
LFPPSGSTRCIESTILRNPDLLPLVVSVDEPTRETVMSDPRYRDPRLDQPPLQEDEIRSQRLNELESSNAMWGWIAGAVVLGLVLMFVFTRGQVNDTTTNNMPAPPAATIGSAPPQNPTMSQAPKPTPSINTPSTTGSGSNQ